MYRCVLHPRLQVVCENKSLQPAVPAVAFKLRTLLNIMIAETYVLVGPSPSNQTLLAEFALLLLATHMSAFLSVRGPPRAPGICRDFSEQKELIQ